MRQIAAILAASLLLFGCGGSNGDSEDSVDFSSWTRSSLVTSYPRDGQTEVPASAPVAMRFSHPLTTADPFGEITFETSGGASVSFSAESFSNGRGIMLIPDQALSPNTGYVVNVGSQTTRYGAVRMPDGGIHFTTRARQEGAAQAISSSDTFEVSRLIPDGDTLPLMDFSSLRVQFTQPIDTSTVDYSGAGTIALRDADGDLVPAYVLAKGPYLTIDPKNELTPGTAYTLQLGSGLRSELGNDLQPGDFGTFTFTPGRTTPRDTTILNAGVSNADPAAQCGPDTTGDVLSPLTGRPVNCVPLQAVLLGDALSVQQTGILTADLAFPPAHPEVTPFRVPRETVLKASSVQVFIAGAAPTGYESGETRVTFLSDAVGYLTPNPYTDDKTAPKRMRMFMDIAMTTANAKANGGLSQDLMHVELVGSAIVQDGQLVIDAVGAVEPKILGQEYGQGLVSFQMASFRDQEAAPSAEPDTTLPTLQSWLPGEDANGQSRSGEMRPGDPIVVNLSEPVAPDSVVAGTSVTLTGPGGASVGSVKVDGATLVIQPQPALAFGGDYTIALTSAITDLAGNPLDRTYNLAFSMPHDVPGAARAPVVTTAYPGYPCVTTDRDIANGDHGRCAGGRSADDHLPVTELPANRAIEVQFSQTMDPASIQLGGSFVVQRNSQPDGSGTWSPVSGRLEVGRRILRFHPDAPWNDGTLYRYILRSNGDQSSGSATCDGSGALCAEDGGPPLQTQMLAQSPSTAPADTGGGPDMEIYFHGAPQTESVLQTFRNLPTIDVNANFVYDGRTPSDDESGCTPATCELLAATDDAGNYVVEENAARIIDVGSGGLALNANTGCGFQSGSGSADADCPSKEFVWLTAGLNSEVLGPGTFPTTDPSHPAAGRQAVRVAVHPNIIYTSNLDVYADIGTVQHTPSGPQIMRIRYATGPGGEPQPLTGWIYEAQPGDSFSAGEDYEPGQPVFEVQANLYLDAPYLTPPLNLPHNLHSYEMAMTLRGPVTFTEDGRMQVRLRNVSAVPIDVSIGGGAVQVDLEIPGQGNSLVFSQTAIKQ